MLTKKQREAIESGEIRNDGMTKLRVRKRLEKSLEDLNFVLQHYKWIEGNDPITEWIPNQESAQLICNLLYLIENEKIDENMLHMLIEESQNNWTVPDSGNIHGSSQEMAIDIWLEAFTEWNPDDPMVPDADKLRNWDDFTTVLRMVTQEPELLSEESSDDA